MSSSSNYNAITNLTETVIDYLVVDTAEIDTAIVESLDCNVGVIDTLTSTTATLTSANIPTLTSTTANITTENTTTANITTANITTENTTTSNINTANIITLNANTIQASPISSAVSLYTTHTGTFTLGNISNTNNLTINSNIILGSTKKVISNSYQPRNSNDAVSLLTEASTSSVITLGGLLATLTINPPITCNGNITMASSKTITLSNVSGSKILCDTYTGTATSSNLAIGESGNTGTLTIHKTSLICQDISARDTASSIGIFTNHLNALSINSLSNTNALVINSNLQVNAVKKLLCDVYTGTATSSNLTIGVSGDTGNLQIFKTITSNNTYSGTNTFSGANTHSGATNTFSNTLLCNTLTGILVGSAISLFGTTTSTIGLGNLSGGTFSINPNTTMNGNLIMASAKNISLSGGGGITVSTTGKIACYQYNSTSPVQALELGATNTTSGIYIGAIQTTGDIYCGHTTPASDTGTLFIQKNTTLAVGKILRTPYLYPTSTIANLYVGNQATDSGILYLELNTDLHSSRKLKLNNLTVSRIVLSDASNNLISSTLSESDIATTSNLALKANIASPVFTGSIGLTSGDITISSGKLVNNTFQGTTAGSSINLYSLSTGSISIGGVSTGILLQDNILTAIGRTLTMTTTGSIINDIYRGISVGNAISLFSTTTGSITLGGASSGISLADNTSLPSNKTLTLSTTGSVLSPTYNSTSATQVLLIGNTNTSANINIGAALTSSGFVEIGSGSGGGVISKDDLYLTSGTFPSITRKTIFCNTIKSNSTIGLPEAGSLYDTNTSNNITCGSALTSGSIVLGRVGQTGVITCNTKLQANTLDGLATSSTITVGGALTNGLLILSNTSNTNAVRVNTKLQQSTASGNAYWNIAVGSANNVFQSSTLSTFAMPPVSAATAPGSATWAVWETNCQGEGAFIAMNGDTTIICNPGDTYAYHWQDEDTMGSALGFKFDKDGVMSVTSDARVKTNIKPYNKNNLLNKLNKIEMINYKRKRPDGITRKSADAKYSKEHTGYTAQQLIEIGLDEFVEQPETPDGYMSVSYGNLQFLFNAGIQELIKENRQRTQENKDMKVVIDDLTARLLKLEQLLIPV